MKKYEFILVVNPTLAQEDVQTTISTVESMLWDGIIEKDDMWYQTVYNVRWLKNQNQAYFVSYLIQTDESEIIWYNKKLSLIKWLLRYVFLAKKSTDPFHHFSEISTKYIEKIEELNKKKTDDKRWSKKPSKKAADVEKVEDNQEVEEVKTEES